MDDRIAQHLDRAAAIASAHAAVVGSDHHAAVARVGSAHHAETLGLTVSRVHELTGLFDRRYVGSVIVNEGNARYYEPAQGRNWTVGLSGAYRF